MLSPPLWSPAKYYFAVILWVFPRHVAYEFPPLPANFLTGLIPDLLFSYPSLMWSSHLIFNIFLRHLFWNVSISLLFPLFIFQVSQPYNSTGVPIVLNNLVLVFLVIRVVVFLLLFHIFPSLLNVLWALTILFLRSPIPPPSGVIVAARYTNLLTPSISCPLKMIGSLLLRFLGLGFVYIDLKANTL